jgi:ribosome-associated heat shock protein Hsp15
VEPTRVDRFLWAIRLYKTRGLATDACEGGHVRINGNAAKPAGLVRVGDRVSVQFKDHERILEVVRTIDKRVGAPIAATCIVDHSPPRPPRAFTAPPALRDPATGRPTKKERRAIDRLRGR